MVVKITSLGRSFNNVAYFLLLFSLHVCVLNNNVVGQVAFMDDSLVTNF